MNDRHINYAQRILCKQFPDAKGLGCTVLQKRKPPKKIENGLQIVHDRDNHWIVASKIGCESNTVNVYASVDPDTVKVILNLFDLPESHHVIQMAGVMLKQ